MGEASSGTYPCSPVNDVLLADPLVDIGSALAHPVHDERRAVELRGRDSVGLGSLADTAVVLVVVLGDQQSDCQFENVGPVEGGHR
ncbi:hypothetical protein PP475_02715 [Mycobacteroides abscessus]|uniref:hypothetical protein n=1 Tax=Mycobacteroides abscessus TaxID=36809 RepID=UPI000695F685|nr:hypothetical protein [Mycobacteroides abscessus]MBN7472026.1 hypothetical protein [Mycobacteroides abscessus subsp. abscessus]MDM2278391.1 hypothetical protein [Mycobacteroides abscessus]MDM2283552.1 hypothetical protein [Mycobacteroides abscessus]MDM2287817.1 hypothetical protein [Mycobacteroides abscessus]MDM2297287.1 hypothetical protein [Mycobacteroides abscessus]